MKIEIHISGAQTVAWLKNALDGYAAAAEADREDADRRFYERMDVPPRSTHEPEPAPAEAEKPKRASRKKAEEPEPKPELEPAVSPTVELETAAQITTNPEDRKPADSAPVEEIEEAEVVTGTVVDDIFDETPAAPAEVYTRDDVKEVMKRYVAKHGMDKLAANAETLLGAPKLSAIPDDAAAFKGAVERLEAAINV